MKKQVIAAEKASFLRLFFSPADHIVLRNSRARDDSGILVSMFEAEKASEALSCIQKPFHPEKT